MGELILNKNEAPQESGDLYSLLGVANDATVEEIRRAYQKAASKHHPDKGGNTEIFKAIKQAYEILSDPEKRQNYDATGVFEGEDAAKVEAARSMIENFISSIIQDESVDLMYLDIVKEIKQHVRHNMRNCELGIKSLNKALKRFNKYKKRAKEGIVRAAFDKNIEALEKAGKQIAGDKEVFELALKIAGTAYYEHDEKPQPVQSTGHPTTGPFHVPWSNSGA